MPAPRRAQMATEVERAIWLPAACSADALLDAARLTPTEPPAHALYFSLIEGVGGEYARQAMLARSSSEMAEWLMACSQRALPLWTLLAREATDMPLDILAMSVRDVPCPQAACTQHPREFHPKLLSRSPTKPLAQVHGVLHGRDNTTDVWAGLDELAEQAGYIWFTREVESLPQSARQLKDPSRSTAASDRSR